MTKKLKRNLKRIIIALSAFLVVMLFDKVLIKLMTGGMETGKNFSTLIGGKYGFLLAFGIYFIIYVYIGHDVIRKAFLNIKNGQMLDENFLMVVATFGAFALALTRGFTGKEVEGFDEGCAVLLFYQVGEWFQSYAVGKSRKDITSLMDIRPDFANVMRGGEILTVSPEEVKTGEIILVKAGEKIPLDGVIVRGTTSLDTRALTGESVPVDVKEGEEVISGSVNVTGTIEVKVLKEFHDSTVSKILNLVENASENKSRAENFITKFSKVYTPAVVAFALLLAVVPSIITKDPSTWIYRALSFLVVSCPCALVISIPLSFFAGIGGASKNGILVKGSNYLEQFNKANVFVFDKTGTITKGNFVVTEVVPENNRDNVLRAAAVCEENSNHPIAKSIMRAYGKKAEGGYTTHDEQGHGIVAVGKTEILCGNEKLMKKYGVEYTPVDSVGTMVYVAEDGKLLGAIVISDEVKPESAPTIGYLNSIGAKTVMLTGDNEKVAASVAKAVGVSEYKSSLLPQDKVDEVEKLFAKKRESDVLCFVGDGINDAPVLMRADIGIAMGGVGSDAAIEASDVVLMHDNLEDIKNAKKIAKKTMRIVYENIFFALGVKLIILILSALGKTNMWFAVFGDVGVAFIAILNAMRANYKIKKEDKKVLSGDSNSAPRSEKTE